MTEHFITHIKVNQSRNVKDLEIPLSSEKRQQLILTGKNGSGKTSLLLEMKKFLSQIGYGALEFINDRKKESSTLKDRLEHVTDPSERGAIEFDLKRVEEQLGRCGGTYITFSVDHRSLSRKWNAGAFLTVFFESKRDADLRVPTGIKKVELRKQQRMTEERSSPDFIQYIVNLKAERSFAKDDGETNVVEKIDEWFSRFENALKLIFDDPNLEIRFDRRNYNFNILKKGMEESFTFNTLSDGYGAIMSIVSELMLRMEACEAGSEDPGDAVLDSSQPGQKLPVMIKPITFGGSGVRFGNVRFGEKKLMIKPYDLEGVVLIDEIETHLHVDLQKKILPFLTGFFPKIQFIVTTHSPFVLSSVSNAVICDLETKEVISDLSLYSYDALIESYFQVDKYSDELKSKLV